ncbi:hypothetical protein KFU94_58140 [Chloroflexi bacterium TSY]|nr:hypothetical protein [Chloroflexi bacterium TSY]
MLTIHYCLAIFGVILIAPQMTPALHAEELDEEFIVTRIYLPSLHTSQVTVEPPSQKQVEWTHHKTTDGQHPDDHEQQIMWLMNRARANPAAEGKWLATTDEEDISRPREYFDVNLNLLQAEFTSYARKPPAAFDVRLYQAAKAHCLDLIARDAQDHAQQFERVQTAGFNYQSIRGSVFAYAQSALNAHAAWNIDWGGPDGMQPGCGHRKAIMSVDGNYTNVGVAVVQELNPDSRVGPFVVTGNYAVAGNGAAHHNRFIVGTVWRDNDGDGQYDVGEGIGDVKVTPDRGSYFAITANSGGFAIPITESGTYRVTFSGTIDRIDTVTVGNESVLLDIKL